MSGQYLNGKLECPTCGTILLATPEEAAEDTPIKCAQCQTPRGTWANSGPIRQAIRVFSIE